MEPPYNVRQAWTSRLVFFEKINLSTHPLQRSPYHIPDLTYMFS
jgi:hypothetical protein